MCVCVCVVQYSIVRYDIIISKYILLCSVNCRLWNADEKKHRFDYKRIIFNFEYTDSIILCCCDSSCTTFFMMTYFFHLILVFLLWIERDFEEVTLRLSQYNILRRTIICRKIRKCFNDRSDRVFRVITFFKCEYLSLISD